MGDDEDLHPTLRPSLTDRAQAGLRSLTSLIDVGMPGLGSIFGELISIVLPAAREDRLALFATKLDRDVRQLGKRLDEMLYSFTPEQLALIEDGLRASARATQEERIDRISRIVAVGAVEESLADQKRQMLDLLGDLSDEDLRVLADIADPWGGRGESLTIGAWNRLTPEQQQERQVRGQLRTLSTQKLAARGLVKRELRLKGGGQVSRLNDRVVPPEIEEQPPKLTSLGQFFCREVGVIGSQVSKS